MILHRSYPDSTSLKNISPWKRRNRARLLRESLIGVNTAAWLSCGAGFYGVGRSYSSKSDLSIPAFGKWENLTSVRVGYVCVNPCQNVRRALARFPFYLIYFKQPCTN
jgi:hypothetical protein